MPSLTRPAAASDDLHRRSWSLAAARLEQAQVMLLAPAGVLAQVQRIRFAGRAGVTGQEPSQGKLFRLGITQRQLRRPIMIGPSRHVGPLKIGLGER